jgi:hypothetical protein
MLSTSMNTERSPNCADMLLLEMTRMSGQPAMCDLAYVNLLREKVRQLGAEEKRLRAFPQSSSDRFVPYILPAQSTTTAVLEPAPNGRN